MELKKAPALKKGKPMIAKSHAGTARAKHHRKHGHLKAQAVHHGAHASISIPVYAPAQAGFAGGGLLLLPLALAVTFLFRRS